MLGTFATGQRRIVRITTRLGYQIDVSAEHPLLVADTRLPRFVAAGELTPDLYACLSRTVVDAGAPVRLQSPPPGLGRSVLCLPDQLDESLAWLLGVIVGDGSYRDRRDGTVDITNQDAEVLSESRRILQTFGLRVSDYRPPGRRAPRQYVVSLAFRRWLLDLGLDYVTAGQKAAPPLLFGASSRIRAAFLRGLFDTDGSAGTGVTRSCRLVTSSRRLASEVQELLLSLGIVSYVSRVTERAYCVGVSGTSLEPFAQTIGFTVGYKQARLQAMLARPVRPRTTNVDRLPFSRLLMAEVSKALAQFWGRSKGIKGRGVFRQVGLRRGGRTRLALLHTAVTQLEGKLSYRNLQEVVAHLKGLGAPVPEVVQRVQRTHYFYDKIKSVELTNEAAEMYDIEVDGVHSFVSRGFVCHNSQGAEFPAVVIPLLTSHAALLGRTLLYTAVTRARRLMVIVGQRKALSLAVHDWRREPRYTALQGLLDGTLAFRWPRPAAGVPGATPPAADATEETTPAEPDPPDVDPWEGLLTDAPEV